MLIIFQRNFPLYLTTSSRHVHRKTRVSQGQDFKIQFMKPPTSSFCGELSRKKVAFGCKTSLAHSQNVAVFKLGTFSCTKLEAFSFSSSDGHWTSECWYLPWLLSPTYPSSLWMKSWRHWRIVWSDLPSIMPTYYAAFVWVKLSKCYRW